MAALTGEQIAGEGLHGWSFLLRGLQTRVHTGTFATGLALVNAIGAVAEEMNHHPELTLRHHHVDVRVTSQGVTDRDIRLARAITTPRSSPRIAAALAAGGTLVSDADAPRYWVLADADGNRVCLCTWQDRD